jgi:hypothetical protein
MKKDEEEKDMLAQVENDVTNNSHLRKPKNKRTNLLSSTTPDQLRIINEKTKKNRGLSNLTYHRVFGEE